VFANQVDASKCTFLGAYTSCNNTGFTQSTALGYGAQITASNQIVLGTATETVTYPGAYCFFGDSYAMIYYNTAGSTVATPLPSPLVYYIKFSRNDANSKNWVPTYNSTYPYRMNIPFTGIYFLHFTFFGSSGSPNVEMFIGKNGSGNELNNIGQVLCTNQVILSTTQESTISTSVYLTTSDYITFGFYLGSGTATPGVRTSCSATLIHRTA
jgi:hypothetical protein